MVLAQVWEMGIGVFALDFSGIKNEMSPFLSVVSFFVVFPIKK